MPAVPICSSSRLLIGWLRLITGRAAVQVRIQRILDRWEEELYVHATEHHPTIFSLYVLYGDNCRVLLYRYGNRSIRITKMLTLILISAHW